MFSSRQWRKGLRMDSAVLKENKQTKPTQLQQQSNKKKQNKTKQPKPNIETQQNTQNKAQQNNQPSTKANTR